MRNVIFQHLKIRVTLKNTYPNEEVTLEYNYKNYNNFISNNVTKKAHRRVCGIKRNKRIYMKSSF